MTLLHVEDLGVGFRTEDGEFEAISNVSFDIGAGEIVGMVGESGSGKSVTGSSLMRLLPSKAVVRGRAELDGHDLITMSEKQIRRFRGEHISMIFQEPMTALDPVLTIGTQLVETLRTHRRLDRKEAKRRAVELLTEVGIPVPEKRFHQYPHQLSGGMRQRAMIAIAVSCEPKLLIADEPTTAVDVTIQAQILQLLKKLSVDHGTAILFISHDIGVISQICERMLVMYAGQLIETGDIDSLLWNPLHPYTSGLMGAVPKVHQQGRELTGIPGQVPQLGRMPEGCRFAPRCPYAEPACGEPQELLPVPHPGPPRDVRCRRSDELDLPGALA